MTTPEFQKTILDWHKNNRRDLPWRKTKNPYKILVSEVMLQQTQISRVLPKYKEFLKEFPTFEALTKTSDEKLLKVWSGLGYWRRAKYLKETAQKIPKKFPREPKVLETFPGIGSYTARALACFAFNSKEAFIDTNIRRIYLHFFFSSKKDVNDKEILQIAQKAIDQLPKEVTSREWHYALFDYGAIELKDKTINKRSHHYTKQSKFKGSFRSFRTKTVRFLLSQPQSKISHKELQTFLQEELRKSKSPDATGKVIKALLKDKLIKRTKTHYVI